MMVRKGHDVFLYSGEFNEAGTRLTNALAREDAPVEVKVFKAEMERLQKTNTDPTNNLIGPL